MVSAASQACEIGGAHRRNKVSAVPGRAPDTQSAGRCSDHDAFDLVQADYVVGSVVKLRCPDRFVGLVMKSPECAGEETTS